MSIFNEYLTGIDRTLAIEESAFDTEFSKLQTMYEMTNLQLAQMQKDAELKVLTESGTYDDLTYLITEAEAEVGEQKKGIIARIVDAIGRLFTSIGNKIQSIFNSGDANIEVEVPVEVVNNANALTATINEAQNGVAKLRNGDWSGALDILNAVKIPAIVAGGAVATGVAIKKYKKEDLDALVKKVNNVFTKLKNSFDSAKSKILGTNDASHQNLLNSALVIIQKIGSAANGFISAITSSITKAITKVAGGEEDKAEGEKPEAKDEEPKTDGQNEGQGKQYRPFSTNYKGTPYRLLANGSWEKKNKKTGKWNVVPTAPNKLQELAKSKVTQESTVDEIQAILGSNYTVEFVNGELIINDVITESASIFGYDLSNEDVFNESSDEFIQELQELSSLFESL